jgi:endonuclease/exonuclease/phosphatase family metal-dependent hydrolase
MTISIFGRGGRRRLAGKHHARHKAPASKPPVAAAAPGDTLRLMSLNIAHARRKAQHQSLLKDSTIRRNLELIAGVLEREQPHVVALQEADGPSFWSGGFDHVAALAGLAGFPHAFRGEHNREVLSRLDLSYGTALLSHLPLEATHSQAFLQNWRDTKGFVAATVAPDALAGEPVDVVSIHLDFLADRVRRRQVEQLIERFRDHEGHLVVMGDFNCSWSERRRSLDLLLHELKLRPCRESGAATYPAWRPLVQLDWILVSEGLEFSAYDTLDDRVSDHLGVVAEVHRRTSSLHPRGRVQTQARRLPSVSLA